MFEKFKQFMADDSLYYTIVLLLIGVISFGLGRVSVVQETQSANVSNTTAAVTLATTSAAAQIVESTLVGSKNGTKYHLLWCSGASQIKEANKVFFADETEAIAAGYSKAGNCPGL